MPQQRTIAEQITCTGIGLHSGESVTLVISPARADTGLVFVRCAGSRVVEIPARSEFVSSTANATTLSREGLHVATVEHLLATLRTLGVDNARIEVDGAEIPAMDGSAALFTELVRKAGLRSLPEMRRVIVIRKPVRFVDGQRSIRIEPARNGCALTYAVDFEHPFIGRQVLEVADLTPAYFESELAAARTFGFLDQAGALRDAGLARGASLETTLVLGDDGVMNPGGLRWPDEFVRHKVLDLLGDLALLGHPLRARVCVERGGHGLHRAGIDALLAQPEAFELVSETSASTASSRTPAAYAPPL